MNHLEIANRYAGVLKEIGANEGWNDDAFTVLASKMGWKRGNSWCAYFVKVCLYLAKAKIDSHWQGLARDYYTHGFNTIDITTLLNGDYKKLITPGDLIIWQKGDTITGHIAIVNKVLDNYNLETIEGNTSSGVQGSQSNGDGCYYRQRKLGRGTKDFHIIGVSKVLYE